MTTVLDNVLPGKVLAIIAKYGKLFTFVVTPGLQSGYDPSTGDVVATPMSYQAKASPPDAVNARFVDGDVIRVGDAEIYLPAQGLAFTPILGMDVQYDSESWKAVAVDPIYSGELVAVWKVVMRK